MAPPVPESHTFRNDIQGLRAVAVLLVLIWHARFTWLPHGYVGVDAFFVISGFLITGLLLKERQDSGRVDMWQFYARRAKRLLPAACVVIAATIIAAYFMVPEIRWDALRKDALGSIFYFENWRLASSSIDYVAQDAAPSPFQHFWSLAVEEQFYLVWPWVFIVCSPPGSFSNGRLVKYLGGCTALLFVVSLGYSMYLTSSQPGPAYFNTGTRVFEFAAGAGVAVFIHRHGRRPLGRLPSAAMGWVGLALLIGSALYQPEGLNFPGYIALAPVIGTVMILLGGLEAGSAGPAIVLSRRPMVFIGALSYSLYLWHWPMLVVIEARFGALSLVESASIVAASIVPAYLTYRFIETPGRTMKVFESSDQGLALGAISMAVAAVAAVALGVAAPKTTEIASSVQSELDAITQNIDPVATAPTTAPSNDSSPDGTTPDTDTVPTGPTTPGLGALSLDEPGEQATFEQPPQVDEIINDPLTIGPDVPDELGCRLDFEESEPKDCVFGAIGSDREIVVVGNSLAAQWMSAFDAIAEAKGWQFRLHAKATCSYTTLTLPLPSGPYTECTEWNKRVREQLLASKPEVVVVTTKDVRVYVNGSQLNLEDSVPYIVQDHVDLWSELIANGTKVIALDATPIPNFDIPECVSTNRDDLATCTFDSLGELVPGAPSLAAAAERLPEAAYISMNDFICPQRICPVVVGGVLVYRDETHLSDTYVRTLAPALAAELDKVGAFAE